MRKSALTLMVGAALLLPHISAFALSPLTDTQMKTPAAPAGLNMPVDDTQTFQRLIHVFSTDTDGIIGSSAAPSFETGETIRMNGLTTASNTDAPPNELPEFQPAIDDNYLIEPDVSFIRTIRSTIDIEPR